MISNPTADATMPGRKRKPVNGRRRPVSGIVADWLTWAIRAIVPAIAYLAWLQFQSDARLEEGQALINQKIDEHTGELQRMWVAISKREK